MIMFNRKKPWCIGHRGASAVAPENTLKSFKMAMQLGADMIELDVRLSKDRRVVVIHDAEISRTSNGTGFVRSYTLAELKKFDFGEGEKIPTLEEVLELTKGKILVNIEIKEPDMVKEVVKIIEEFNAEDQVLVSSFIHPVVLAVKKLNPEIRTGVLFGCRPINPIRLAREAQADFLHPYHEAIDEAMVKEAHAEGIGILAWTVDSENSIKRLMRLGVDGIITNDVETCLNIRKQLFGF